MHLAAIYTMNLPHCDFRQDENVDKLYSVSDSVLILMRIINFAQ